jgi:hypothetical protein
VGFAGGTYLGSAEVDDPSLLAAVEGFTAAVGAAFSDRPWVFHLELFAGVGPDGRPAISFLEVAGRVGGAEIPFLWREVYGVDLMAAAVDVQLGRDPVLPEPKRGTVGGYLLVPTPVDTPCRVVTAGWASPPNPTRPYAEIVPAAGTVIPRVGGYEHVGARFRFRGSSSGQVEAAIRASADDFRLSCVHAPR